MVSISVRPTVRAVIKDTTESVAANTTLQNDDELSLELEPFKTYTFQLVAFIDSPAAAGFKSAFAAISGATIAKRIVDEDFIDLDTEADFTEGDTENTIFLSGLVEVGEDPGTLVFTWAQLNSNVGNTSVLEGSFLSVAEVVA